MSAYLVQVERVDGTENTSLHALYIARTRVVHRRTSPRTPLHRRNTACASPMHVRQRICTTETTPEHDVHRAAHRCVTSCSGDVDACSGRARSCIDVFRDDHRGRHAQTFRAKTYLVGEQSGLYRQCPPHRRPRQLLFTSSSQSFARRIRSTCGAQFFAKNLDKYPKPRCL